MAIPFATLTLRTRVPAGTYVRKPLTAPAFVGPGDQPADRIQRSAAGPVHPGELLALEEGHGNARLRGRGRHRADRGPRSDRGRRDREPDVSHDRGL